MLIASIFEFQRRGVGYRVADGALYRPRDRFHQELLAANQGLGLSRALCSISHQVVAHSVTVTIGLSVMVLWQVCGLIALLPLCELLALTAILLILAFKCVTGPGQLSTWASLGNVRKWLN